MQRRFDRQRRRVLYLGAMAVANAPWWGAFHPRWAQAQESLPELAPEDPTAQRLNYHTDAREAASGQREAGAFCRNCTFFRGDRDGESGPCVVFPGKRVNAGGWCESWRSAS